MLRLDQYIRIKLQTQIIWREEIYISWSLLQFRTFKTSIFIKTKNCYLSLNSGLLKKLYKNGNPSKSSPYMTGWVKSANLNNISLKLCQDFFLRDLFLPKYPIPARPLATKRSVPGSGMGAVSPL